ncbi:ATP-grasp fold amidoligase family protein [Evansella halocellulosilytica]|uniref:ATP-grasp fold amidoligase family protein n=1 Tax=Evansella halocellulosilytica TaxID=2011013 RepID=UPI000BB683A8|nr:ATP-grasp fold amidoligase family protein [Evansella halocellulosilytica]
MKNDQQPFNKNNDRKSPLVELDDSDLLQILNNETKSSAGKCIEEQEVLFDKLLKYDAEYQKVERQNKEIQKEKDRINKNYKTITESRGWKLTLPLRKAVKMISKARSYILTVLLGRKFKAVVTENKELKKKNEKLNRSIKVNQERLKSAQIKINNKEKKEQELLSQLGSINEDKLLEMVKGAEESGEILNVLDKLIIQKSYNEEKYEAALKYAAKLYMNRETQLKTRVYNSVIKGLKIEEIPEFIVRLTEETDELSLNDVSSFKANLSQRSRMRQFDRQLPEWILDNKVNAYSFIDILNIKRPWVSENSYEFKEIPKKAGIVIKPASGAGARGVYLILGLDKMIDVKRGQTLHSWEELDFFVKEDLSTGWVNKDEWIIEELVIEDNESKIPARDLKFYCFYGRVALVLEIIRYPNVKYCWWTSTGERIKTGKYDGKLFDGNGVPHDQIKLVETISKEIPSPFIRIDFLNGSNGMVFGEFTPKPGNYDQFNSKIDKLLGDYFIEAEARLRKDFINGKRFLAFRNFLKEGKIQ